MNEMAGPPAAVPAVGETLSAAPPVAAGKASNFEVMKAVRWSFIGIRKRAGFENDVARIKPLQAIVAGVIGAVVFVAALVTLVTFLTAK